MQVLVETGFWACLGWLLYVYGGYPALLLLLGRMVGRDVRKSAFEPCVSVIMAAFNEEGEIERTVVNKLEQDYPAERLSVIVVSDGSTDKTDAIVERLAARYEQRCQLLRQEPRQGKTQALNLAVACATGDVLVFSDANSIYAPDAVRRLVRHFGDPSVGYVTGHMVYTKPAGCGIAAGSGSFMRYENWLRTLETQVNSVVGVDGGIDAVRRDLYVPMRPDQLPDFVLPLSVVEQGKRVIYDPSAILFEPALAVAADELRMRIRVSLRAFWALYDKRSLLNPFRNALFAWQLWSHKALRYGAFLPLAGMVVFNAWLINDGYFYLGVFLLQLLAYVLAFLGHWLSRVSDVPSPVLAPYYFVILNVACAVAFWKFLNGQKMVIWKPRAGA